MRIKGISARGPPNTEAAIESDISDHGVKLVNYCGDTETRRQS